MESVSSITIDETLLTGSEGLTSVIDERTLAYTPAPVAASTVLRENRNPQPRIPFDDGGSFVNNKSVIPGEEEDDGSSDDRSSLGLLPSNYLLDAENDLLFQGNICLSKDIPAFGHSFSSNKSQKNQLLDSQSSREHTSDSHDFMTTVKKCPQVVDPARDGGRYVPQALFQNVAEVNESRLDNTVTAERDFREQNSEKWDIDEPQQNTDSGMGQTNFTNSHRSKSSEAATSGSGVQVTNTAGEENDFDGDLLMAQDQEEDADETFYKVELEAEDLQELENMFSDSSDEDMCDTITSDGGMKAKELSICTDMQERNSMHSIHETNFSAIPSMDGVFKVPLPPSKPSVQNRMHFGTPGFTSTAVSFKDSESSQIFGDSIQFHQSQSVSNWGPSIEFGSSTHIGDTLFVEGDHQSSGKAAKRDKLPDETKTFDEYEYKNKLDKTTGIISRAFDNNSKQPLFPSFGDLAADNGGSKLCQEPIQNQSPFGDFSAKTSSNENQSNLQADPFKDFSGEIAFGDEDFLVDTDAAAAMLAEDEQIFKKENLIGGEMFNSTLGSVRGDDQTFMNMTIGTYMATGSGELGSLTSQDKRPEFGMPVKSPSAVRSAVPILSSDEIFSPPSNNGNQQASADKPEYRNNSQLSLDSNTNACVAVEKGSLQHTLNHYSQEASYVRNLSPVFESSGHQFVQNDSVPPEIHQTASKTNSSTHSETSVQKNSTSESRTGSVNEKYMQTSLTTGTGSQQQLKPESSFKDVNNFTLEQPPLSMTRLEDGTMNSTSDEVTFSSIYKLIERSDISLADPGQLIFSEYNKKVKQKQAAKISKPISNQIPSETGQDTDQKPAKTTTHFQASSKTLRNQTRIPQRIVDTGCTIQKSAVQSNTNILKPETCMPQMQTDKCPSAVTGLLAGSDMPKPEVKSLKNPANSSQTLEIQHAQTDGDLSKPATRISQNDKDNHRAVEMQLVQRDRDLPQTKMHLSQSKTNYTKTQSQNISDVASTTFKSDPQRGETDRSSSRVTLQAVTSAKPVSQLDSTLSNKNIPPENSGNQQRNFIKGPSSEHRSSLLLQSQQMECSEDDNLSLESVTINSQNSMMSTNQTVPHSQAPVTQPSVTQPSVTQPSFLQEKIRQLSVIKPQKNKFSLPANLHQLLNVTTDSSGNMSDVSHFPSLIHDNTSSMLETTEMHDIVSSTPLSANRPDIQKFSYMTQISEKSILPILSPKTALNILDLPEIMHVPEVCCVHLSQQSSFSIRNLLDRGVKCLLTIREVTLRDQRLNSNLCPFELKRQIILSPSSTQNVQVIFRPKDQGEFLAVVEIFSQNMTNPQDNRTYILHLSGYAEHPMLKISPVNDVIDFGDLLWGSTSCRSVRIQNVGHATIPLRFSIFRKESALCNFSFYPENPSDVSSISLTTRPAAAGSIYSMSLPGRKEGQKITTETVNIYCRAKEPQNLNQRFSEKAEKFHAVLSLGVDMPIEDISPLNEIKLFVTVGMYKLHVDREILSISVPPGKTGQGTIKIINSGNIPMHVDISLEPQRDHFSLSTDHVVVPSGENCPVHVTFTPQPIREDQNENKVNLMLQNQITQNYISVIGKVKTTQTRISASTSALNFGGVNLGQSMKQKFTFIADKDDDVKMWIKNPGSAFKLLKEDGAFVENLELTVVQGKQYTVWIIFSPSEVIGYSANLMLQILYANRYVISMNGYGGCSKLVIEKVNESPTGDRWLDIGCLSLGTSIFRKITVKNIGVRCCFIKTSCYDISRQDFQPYRATVMPSTLILSANETIDLLLMLNPSEKEADLCKFGRALVAIIKLTSGDEIMRQQFLSNPGKQSRQTVNDFDIPLTSTQREIVDSELKSVTPYDVSYSMLKKTLSVIKIGLLGDPPPEKQCASPKMIPSRLEADTNRSSLQQRSALAPVSPNIKPTDRSKDDWTVTPSEVHLSVGDSQVKDFVQIINFSTKELQFSVDCDEGLTVSPSKATVKPKNTAMLVVQGHLAYFSKKEPVGRCGLVKVQCLQQVKYVQVYVPITPGLMSSLKPSLPSSVDKLNSLPTTFTMPFNHSTYSDQSKGSLSHSPSGSFGDHAGRRSPLSTDGKEAGSMKIQGSDMIIFPPTEKGTKRDQTYFFTNIGTKPLTWELAPFAPPYVKHADNTQNLYRINYDVFRLSPLTGVLQPEETEKVSIEFQPQCKGSFNQAWCIYDTAKGQNSSHRFSVYAKALPNPSLASSSSEEVVVPQGLSPTQVSAPPRGRLPIHNTESLSVSRQPALSTAKPSSTMTTTLNPSASWSTVSQTNTEIRHPLAVSNEMTLNNPAISRHSGETRVPHNTTRESETSSFQSSLLQQPNMAGDNSLRSDKEKGPTLKGLHLVHDVIEFPKLHLGETIVLKIHLKNLSSEDIQVVIEHEPRPPFLIKHYSFKVGKDKMLMYPVTFKPRHVDKFKDKVIFRDTSTGNTFTASLEAECFKD